MKTIAPIILFTVTMHYLFTAVMLKGGGLKTVFLCGCVLVGAWLVAMFNEWGKE